MIEVKRYTEHYFNDWNQFLKSASNGTFLLHRNFMEYHSDRFQDHSLLFFKKGKLLAILPSNLEENSLHSHQGLSYGGLIFHHALNINELIACFKSLHSYGLNNAIQKIVYKPTPQYYHSSTIHSDTYLFQKLGATSKIEAASVIDIKHSLPFQQRRKRGIKKARKNELKIEADSSQWEVFWEILGSNLSAKYQKKPVHTLEEIQFLKSNFPNSVQLFLCLKDGEVIAGTVLFLHTTTIHAQYIASNPLGRKLGGLDCLVDYLLRRFRHLNYFSLGVNDYRNHEGQLNQGLTEWKEGFGARLWPHYQFEIEVDKLKKLEGLLR